MPRGRMSYAGPAFALVLVIACGDDDAPASGGGHTADAPPAPNPVLLEQAGELASTDPSDARGRYDRYFVDVAANDRVLVTLTSSAFDPIVEVTPPASGTLVNDDWQGDRTRSQLELIASAAGAMKIEVRSYTATGTGAYQLAVRRVAGGESASVPVLTAGQTAQGELREGDHTLSGGDVFDSYVVSTSAPSRITVAGEGGAAPRTTLVGPDGLTLEPRDGHYEAPDHGSYRLQVIGHPGTRYRVEVANDGAGAAPLLARAHHQFNQILGQLATATGNAPSASSTQPLPIRVGDRLNGNLAGSDARLPSGELYDVYELSVSAPAGDVSVELESSAIDTFLRVEGPGGERWENDDYGGTRNSRVDVALSSPGTYRIVATSYRAGETGPYELKVLGGQRGALPGNAPPVNQQTATGSLRPSDSTLASGEYYDEHRFTWPVGARVHLEARSSDFDTYLIVHPPHGAQQDNDDMVPGQTTDAGLDLQVAEAGEWRVIVTSYQPHETGDYTLVVESGGSGQPVTTPAPAPTPSPTPAPGPSPMPSNGSRTETGTLAQGDTTLRSGEFTDSYEMTFAPQSAVSIRLESTEFDPYLIVRAPSGQQEDNDDFQSGQLGSGIDIPVAEPGTYRIIVTSYRPGETGRYTLTVTEGPSVVSPTPPAALPNGTPAPSGGGHVWGLFAGITDYPGDTNDLPECANDARKLAEAVRNQGNMPSDQEFLLTDGQATAGGIRQAMQAIASRIRPDDVFVFFYSGHGGQTDNSQDVRELDQRDEYLFTYDGPFLDDELGQLFDQIHARVALISIDACFSGGFAKDVITRPGRVGMFSSEEDVTSAVADQFQAGGYLSHFLRLGIQGEADNDPHNDILTVGELTHYTWVQFGQHASDVHMSMGYQQLVVDRGAVHNSEVLWAVRR